jgi:hypothetical protein
VVHLDGLIHIPSEMMDHPEAGTRSVRERIEPKSFGIGGVGSIELSKMKMNDTSASQLI